MTCVYDGGKCLKHLSWTSWNISGLVQISLLHGLFPQSWVFFLVYHVQNRLLFSLTFLNTNNRYKYKITLDSSFWKLHSLDVLDPQKEILSFHKNCSNVFSDIFLTSPVFMFSVAICYLLIKYFILKSVLRKKEK